MERQQGWCRRSGAALSGGPEGRGAGAAWAWGAKGHGAGQSGSAGNGPHGTGKPGQPGLVLALGRSRGGPHHTPIPVTIAPQPGHSHYWWQQHCRPGCLHRQGYRPAPHPGPRASAIPSTSLECGAREHPGAQGLPVGQGGAATHATRQPWDRPRNCLEQPGPLKTACLLPVDSYSGSWEPFCLCAVVIHHLQFPRQTRRSCPTGR